MTPAELLSAAVIMGLAGSLHCAAMCGPLALAGCSRDGKLSGRSTAAYFIGRLISYATVGATLGHLGRHALCRLPVGRMHAFTVALVAIPVAWRGLVLLRRRPTANATATAATAATGPALVQLQRSRPRRTPGLMRLLPLRGGLLGIATGILPCGMLLAAAALAAASQHALVGAGVMTVFALASMPGLLVPLLGRRLLSRLAARLPPSAAGLGWLVLAAWLAVRPWLGAHHHH